MFGCQTKTQLILEHGILYVKIFLKSKVVFKMSNGRYFWKNIILRSKNYTIKVARGFKLGPGCRAQSIDNS